MSYFREWGPPSTPVRTLCPIDHSKQNLGEDRKPTGAEGGTEAGAGLGPGQDNRDSSRRKRGGARGRGAGGGSGGPGSSRPNLPYAQSMNINGRKMLICNINGMYFQVCRLYTYMHDIFVIMCTWLTCSGNWPHFIITHALIALFFTQLHIGKFRILGF